MPRARTLALAVFVSLASLGLASGLAFRWLLRDAILQNAFRTATLGSVLRPRGDDGKAVLWGLAFLPVFWGGFLTFLAPLVLLDTSKAAALVLPWVAVFVLGIYMRFLYLRPTLLPAGAESEDYPFQRARLAAWSRHLKIALCCGIPGLLLCTVCFSAGEPGPIGVMALLSVVPALVGPWFGALAALAVLARASRLATREVRPETPSWPRRIAVGVAAVALGAVWLAAARAVLAPAGDPLLTDEDFSRPDACYGTSRYSYSAPATPPTTPEEVQAQLSRAGFSCDSAGLRFGDHELAGRRLAWCLPSQEQPRLVHFFAIDLSQGRVIASRQLSVQSTEIRSTSAGVVVVTRDGGGLRLVRIGRDARVDAEWRAPEPPQTGSWTLLEVDRAGGLAFGWEHRPGRVGLTRLTDDLVPVGPPAIASAVGNAPSLTTGKAACLHVYDGRSVALVLDREGHLLRPPLAERLAVRAGSAFHVGWTGLVLGLLAAIALRAALTRRKFSRGVTAGAFSEGSLSPTDEDAAILRRTDGQVVRVRTSGAAWHGFADGEPHEGPCLVVGAGAAAGAGAYRSAPPEIDARAAFGIVRGDLGQARVWATVHRDRIVATVVAVGWLVTGPALLALWI
jgi:hypothetical protein